VSSNVLAFRRRDASPAAGRDATDPGATVTPAPLGRVVYTVKETAQLLSLSLGSTYQLIRAGEIPAMKLGGRWVVPKRRLHEWIDGLPEASTDDLDREIRRAEHADQRATRPPERCRPS
jgi:excisionase family DNA binding protein